jgi:hypothetical protein
MAVFQKSLNAIRAQGGRDIPEAVNEALYDAITDFPWDIETPTVAVKKIIILIGDAPPHPIPRGNITEKMAIDGARESGITINAIVLPQ